MFLSMNYELWETYCELLWTFWTTMKLLKLLNYELIVIEVIEL